MNALINKYPWLKITTTVENYIDPAYYNNLLKPYVFSGKSDLELFRNFLRKFRKVVNLKCNALELGCGNGRATRVFLETVQNYKIDLVDLSQRMIRGAKKNLKSNKNISYFISDSINYLEENNKTYDLIFSLWSFSHSVHQTLTRHGMLKGKKKVRAALSKAVLLNMNKGSHFFLIHFDSLSDEQRILIKQWKKNFPIFRRNKLQSPSKLIIDETLKELSNKGYIKYSTKHYIGKAIKYDSLDEALETFMNFHMESFFNKSPRRGQIIRELSTYFNKFKRKNGKFYIRPGCYIYSFTKII